MSVDERRLPRDLVLRHKLAPLAYKAGFRDFQPEYIRTALLAELRRPVLDEVVAALVAAGVRVALLKGCSYIGEIYADPAERPVGDIDLLVPVADHEAAGQVLVALGFRPRATRAERSSLHHARTFVRADGAAVDLHRSMVQPLRSRIDLASIWGRTGPAAGGPDGAERLHPVDEALFHLAHIARHELLVPAIAYVDAPRLMGRAGVSEGQVLERAAGFRLARAVGAALAMARVLARGAHAVSWSDARLRVMPTPAQVLACEGVSRWRQLTRKAALLEGPRELAGLLVVAASAGLGLPGRV